MRPSLSSFGLAMLGLVILSLATGALSSSVDDEIAAEVSALIDWDVDPCDDFWHFACGAWINSTTLPADKSSLTRSFTVITDRNQDLLRAVVEDADNVKLNAFYSACLDMDAINDLGATPALALISVADAVYDLDTFVAASANLYAYGVPTFFGFGATVDSFHPESTIAGLGQGGLGLPYPSLYTDIDAQPIRDAYVTFLTSVFKLVSDADPAGSAQTVLNFETKIAAFTVPPDGLVDPFITYNPMPFDQFKKMAPGVNWDVFTRVLGLDLRGNLTVDVPAFFTDVAKLVGQTQVKDLVVYLRSRILIAMSDALSQDFRDASFAFFGTVLGGQKKPQELWRHCLSNTDNALGELLGAQYVKLAFPGQSQTDAVDLLDGIVSAMQDDLNALPWMDEVTRSRALKKLSQVSHQIGSPATPDQYTTMEIGDVYFNNVLEANYYARQKDLNRIGKPTNKLIWGMTAPTVNAYYDPTLNQMVFPAGILQQPFFNASFPPEMNAGGIGMVMGHELTHGFDNQGRLYDGTGVLRNWWQPETSKKFDDKVQCVIDQYSKFSPIPGVNVNGKLTQGENIADMGGIKNSFHAISVKLGDSINATSIVSKLTRGQLFFTAFAQGWCTKASDAYYKLHTATDPHSPPEFRVLGPLINLPAFSDVFSCPVGSRMNPTDRCEVW